MSLKLLVSPLLVFAISLAVYGADDKKDAKKSDNLDGTWVPESAEMAGQKFPEEIRKAVKLEIKGDKYTVTIANVVDKGAVKYNASAKPKELDITGDEGPNKGKTFLAIYELDGDTLKVCYDMAGKVRPKEFKSKANTALFLVTYKREKK